MAREKSTAKTNDAKLINLYKNLCDPCAKLHYKDNPRHLIIEIENSGIGCSISKYFATFC